jgi:hypothetical protein
MMLVRKVTSDLGFPGFFLRRGSGRFTKEINSTTLFKFSIVGLYFFDLTDKKSDIYPSLKIMENHTAWEKITCHRPFERASCFSEVFSGKF